MYTKQQIIDYLKPLLIEVETINGKPELVAFWDRSRYSIGFGTISFKGEIITTEEAYKRFEAYISKMYDDVAKILPTLKNQLIFVPLLSKAYQYGSGVAKSWLPFINNESILISEVFFKNEDYPIRREKEISYYKQLLEKNNHSGALVIIISIGLFWAIGKQLKLI
jgi:hypothetical protein